MASRRPRRRLAVITSISGTGEATGRLILSSGSVAKREIRIVLLPPFDGLVDKQVIVPVMSADGRTWHTFNGVVDDDNVSNTIKEEEVYIVGTADKGAFLAIGAYTGSEYVLDYDSSDSETIQSQLQSKGLVFAGRCPLTQDSTN